MSDRDGGDRGVSNSHHESLASVITLEETRHPRDRPGDVVVLQTVQELFGGRFLFGAKTGIDFCHVDRATSQEMALPQEIE